MAAYARASDPGGRHAKWSVRGGELGGTAVADATGAGAPLSAVGALLGDAEADWGASGEKPRSARLQPASHKTTIIARTERDRVLMAER